MLRVITAVVLVVWCANFAASLLVPDYDGTAINGIFTVFLGAMLAVRGKNGGQDDDDEDDGPGRTRPNPTRSLE